jgi:hypothetical protein
MSPNLLLIMTGHQGEDPPVRLETKAHLRLKSDASGLIL